MKMFILVITILKRDGIVFSFFIRTFTLIVARYMTRQLDRFPRHLHISLSSGSQPVQLISPLTEWGRANAPSPTVA